jgi:hypothetical protein
MSSPFPSFPELPANVPGWAVATAVSAAISRVVRLGECIADGELDDAAIIAEGVEVDLTRWLREAGAELFQL